MAKKVAPLLPSTEALLQQFGERLRLARLRRNLSAKQVCERAGMVPMTLRSLERGHSGVTMGAYLAVMQVLGIEQDIGMLGQVDSVGRSLQDARLPAVRVRSGLGRKSLDDEPAAELSIKATIPRLPAGGDTRDEMRKGAVPDYAEMVRLASAGKAMEEMREAVAPDFADTVRVADEGNPIDTISKTVDWESQNQCISSDVLAELITSPRRKK